jgi:hypothetical protein
MRSLLLLLTLSTLLLPPSQAATVSFTAAGTVFDISGNRAMVDATVTISTFTDMVQVQVFNNIVGPTRDLQAISAVDFVLSNGYTAGTLSSRSGLTRDAGAAGFSISSLDTGWAVLDSASQTSGLANGMSLTTLQGVNSSFSLSNSVAGGTNPYLLPQSGPLTFNILLTGVTVDTTVLPDTGNVRFFFGADRSAWMDAVVVVPEAGSLAMMGVGLVGLSLLGRWRSKA